MTKYLIVPKEGSKTVIGGRIQGQDSDFAKDLKGSVPVIGESNRPNGGMIVSPVFRRVEDIPDRIANLAGFEPDDYVIQFDGRAKGYINPSDIEAVVDLEALTLTNELDKLDKSIVEP